MAESEEHEVVETPATHKKKAQAFLFILLGILVVVMIFDVIRKSGRDEEAQEQVQQSAPVPSQSIDIQSFDERLEAAKREREYRERSAQPQPTVAEVVARAQEQRQGVRAQRGGFNVGPEEKTPAQIFLEAEQMRAWESRRSKLVVNLGGRDSSAPQQAAVGGIPQRSTRLPREHSFLQDELARVREQQRQLMAGQAPAPAPANLGGGFAQPSNATAQTSADFEVGKPVAEQQLPKPGQVLLATGTVISAALDQFVISDITGSWRGIISQDVYDKSGRFVLIPKGAELTGKSFRLKGINEPIQNRMILTNNWCVLPNGKRISFNKTVTMDATGIAALKDKVNYHLIPQILGVAAYAVLSSETSRTGSGANNDTSFAGDVGAAMREQFAPLAAKYLSLVPTVTLGTGTPMRIFIEDDIFITPWDRSFAGVLPRG